VPYVMAACARLRGRCGCPGAESWCPTRWPPVLACAGAAVVRAREPLASIAPCGRAPRTLQGKCAEPRALCPLAASAVSFYGHVADGRPRAAAQNAGHHLVGAGRLDELKALLASPGWLERKLHSYGTAAVVADFRRHLMVAADEEVKLLLEAFQMSISACLAHPGVPLLRAQMLGRLMAAAAAASLPGRLAAEEAAPEAAGRHAAAPPCLFSRTPSLEQARALPRPAAERGLRSVLHGRA